MKKIEFNANALTKKQTFGHFVHGPNSFMPISDIKKSTDFYLIDLYVNDIFKKIESFSATQMSIRIYIEKESEIGQQFIGKLQEISKKYPSGSNATNFNKEIVHLKLEIMGEYLKTMEPLELIGFLQKIVQHFQTHSIEHGKNIIRNGICGLLNLNE